MHTRMSSLIYIYIDIDYVVKYLKIDILCLFHCWQSVGTK